MRKYRILGIAPYQSLQAVMQQEALKRDDIELTAYVGDLEDGAEIAAGFSRDDFDFIISRGGTARMIRERTIIPVVEIALSVNDIYRCVELAERSSKRYAIVGFPNITKNVRLLQSVMRGNIRVFTINSSSEANQILSGLTSTDCDMVLTDSVSYTTALKYQFNSMLITSGAESVNEAFDTAVAIGNACREISHENAVYREILASHPSEVFIYDTEGVLLYRSKTESYYRDLSKALAAMIPEVRSTGQQKVYRRYQGSFLTITGTIKVIDSQELVFFYISAKKVSMTLLKNGFIYLNREDILSGSDNFYLNNAPRKLLDMIIGDRNYSGAPVIILGERGANKQQLAEYLYVTGEWSSSPLTVIDCLRFESSKHWDYLMEDTNSPLSDTGTTVLFRDIARLSENKFLELVHTLQDTGFHHRNYCLFDMDHVLSEPYPERYTRIKNLLGCSTVEIPPLRNVPEYIPMMANLLIASYNAKSGKEIAGLDQDAAREMSAFGWPFNYNQLKRVVELLAAECNGVYIDGESVARILKTEERESEYKRGDGAANTRMDLSGDLDEITKRIIEQVLAEEGGNQTAAAKRLKIGRTTLWRLLKQ